MKSLFRPQIFPAYPEARLAGMREATQPWSVSVPAQEAGIAAAAEKSFLEETRRALETEKSFLLEHLLKYRLASGAFEASENPDFLQCFQQMFIFPSGPHRNPVPAFFQSRKITAVPNQDSI